MWCHPYSTQNIPKKTNISYPLIETQKYFYQGTKKLVFRKICIHPKGADLTFYKKIMIRNKLYSKALEIGYTTIFWNILHSHLVFCSKRPRNRLHDYLLKYTSLTFSLLFQTSSQLISQTQDWLLISFVPF